MQADWPILVITLEGDEARRQPLLDRLDRMGLSWRLVLGIDGRRGLPAECLALIDRRTAEKRLRRPMTDAEFACALSHRRAYQIILNENMAGALIFEDDARPTPDLVKFIHEGLHRTDTLALLDYSYGRALPWQKRQHQGWTFYRAAQRATNSSAYTISRSSADRMLDATTPVSFAADWPLDLYDLRAWLIQPRLSFHEPASTSLSHLAPSRSDAAKREKQKDIRRYLEADYWRSLVRRKLARRVGR